MQLNNLKYMNSIIMPKFYRITYFINLQIGNVSVILIYFFYFIFHSLKNTFLNFNCAGKALKKDD